MYSTDYLQQRRRVKRVHRTVTFGIVLAMLGIMAAMALLATPAPPQAHGAPAAKGVCNERCQLTRAIRRVCPSQPRAMTRRRCIQWVQVAQCESGGQQYRVTLTSIRQIGWRTNEYHDGGLQFTERTWRSNVARIPARQLTRFQRIQRREGRYRYAYRAPAAVQILAAEVLRKRIGGNPQQSAGWPTCGAWFYR